MENIYGIENHISEKTQLELYICKGWKFPTYAQL